MVPAGLGEDVRCVEKRKDVCDGVFGVEHMVGRCVAARGTVFAWRTSVVPVGRKARMKPDHVDEVLKVCHPDDAVRAVLAEEAVLEARSVGRVTVGHPGRGSGLWVCFIGCPLSRAEGG